MIRRVHARTDLDAGHFERFYELCRETIQIKQLLNGAHML
jgi:CTP synthase (UTP-ammonia lyase)